MVWYMKQKHNFHGTKFRHSKVTQRCSVTKKLARLRKKMMQEHVARRRVCVHGHASCKKSNLPISANATKKQKGVRSTTLGRGRFRARYRFHRACVPRSQYHRHALLDIKVSRK